MTPSTRAPADAATTIEPSLTPSLRHLLGDVGTLAMQRGVAAYAVGGCVRDWLLHRPINEIDIMIEGEAMALAQLFATAHRGTLVTHPQFRTATVEYRAGKKAQRVDFATCRKETYSEPAAYPTVSAGSIEDDLFRRDFTINAMAVALGPRTFGQLIDLFGGLKDVRARCIRVLHPQSFRDDPSRILRAVRFAERLHFMIEPHTGAWLRAALQEQMLARLNRGRLRKELTAMLEEPDPWACLRTLGQWLLDS